MNDTCAACGRPIFTVNAGASRGQITLAQRWTHGGLGIIDRQHLPIPTHHRYRIER